MNSKEIENLANFWKSILPEIRPMPSHVQFWERQLKIIVNGNKDINTLVLGVTPEIRDLLGKYSVKTTCLDINPKMADAMSLLTKEKNKNEKIIIGNWLNMDSLKNQFDLLISDCPHDNLPISKLEKFFKNLSEAVKLNGYVFFASPIFRGREEAIGIDEYIQTYRNNPANFKSNKLYYLLKLTSNQKYYNSDTKVANWPEIQRDLEEKVKSGRINEKEFLDIDLSVGKLRQSLSMTFTWLKRDELENFFVKNNLKIFKSFVDEEFIFKIAYILQKI